MGCQLESQGAALKELQKAYAAKGVLLCGVNRIEHPYDVEDYLRHFGLAFPVFVDTCEESPSVARASLGDVVILDRDRKRVRLDGNNEFEPVAVKSALEQVLAHSGVVTSPPCVLRADTEARTLPPPAVAAGWSTPVRLGTGRYPRLVPARKGKLLCLWVTGEVPQQQLECAIYAGGRWEPGQRLATGKDAHAVAADADAEGRPVIVWAQKDPEGYRVYLNRYVDGAWQPPTALSPPGTNAFRPDVFCLPSGRTLVAWYAWKRVKLISYPNAWWRSIYVCEVVSSTPGVPCELAELRRGSDDCWDPVITGSVDNLQVTWLRDENPPKLWCSTNSGFGWRAPASVLRAAGSNCRVQAVSPVRSANVRHALVFEMFSPWGSWPFRTGTQIYLVPRALTGWGEPFCISSSPGRHVAPSALKLADENYLVFWCHLPSEGKPSTIRMRRVNGKSRDGESETLVATGEGSNSYPCATVDGLGTVWLAWQSEESNAGDGIYISTRRASALKN